MSADQVRQQDPREVIDRIKAQVGVRSDEDLANWISRQRQKRGSYKIDASKHVIRQTVANWRSATRVGVPLEVLAEIAEWEGVYIEWLLWGEEPRYRPKQGAAPSEASASETATAAVLARLLEKEPSVIRTIREAAEEDNKTILRFLTKLPQLKPEQLQALGGVLDTYVP